MASLTLRDGVHLNDAIVQAKQIDEQSKAAGFYQEALDYVAKAGFQNAIFEEQEEDQQQIIDEFYLGAEQQDQEQQNVNTALNGTLPSIEDTQRLQQGLKNSVRAMN